MTKLGRRFAIGAVIAILATVTIVAIPRLIEASKYRQIVTTTCANFASALVHGDYVAAYAITSADFREHTSYDEFVSEQNALQARYGRLEQIVQKGSIVRGRGTPPRWSAQVNTTLLFQRGHLDVVYEFHDDGGKWLLHGYAAK